MRRSHWGVCSAFVVALAATPSFASAQGIVRQEGVVPAAFAQLGPAETHLPRERLDIPQPPRVIGQLPELPSHKMPPIPVGPDRGVPQPGNAPIVIGTPPGPGAPCDLQYFVNRPVTPAGVLQSTVGEPATAQNRDTVFQTANWNAALSLDSGMTWTHINPFTRFPSVDSGFCCDQRALYIPSHDMTIWWLQYSYSSTTQRGSIRLAVSTSRNNLANDVWHSWVIDPQVFGRPVREWFDFPDIAYSDGHLYATSNVFDSGDNNVDSILWKMSLDDVKDAGGLSTPYWTRASTAAIGASGSYRFTQGATTTMYAASHLTTSSIRLFRNADASNVMNWTDASIGVWSDGPWVATAPNGVNWAGRLDSRVTGGYATGSEYGFMWSVGPRAGRPSIYVRVSKFRTSDNSLIGEEDIYEGSGALAIMYPAVATNALGHKGYTCAFGQANGLATGWHPTNFYRVVDPAGCGINFGGGGISVPFVASHSPARAAWGDYFTVQRHSVDPNTFVATGMRQFGGSGNADQEPRYLWFGTEAETPVTPIVTVEDAGFPGSVPIVVNHMDLDGLTNGSTTFTRRYGWTCRYELVAPLALSSAGIDYRFLRWRLDVNGGTNFFDYPVGQTVLAVDSIGGVDDRAQAVYDGLRTIEVRSINPSSGIPITVSQADVFGNQNGTTTFTRIYRGGSSVSFTAPAFNGPHPFNRWYLNGFPQALGDRVLTRIWGASASAAMLEAEYCTHYNGAYDRFGVGCRGSNGVIPFHNSTSQPDTGNFVTHTVSGLYGPTPAVMFLGFSTTRWNGIPLPLSLGVIGANPACNVLTDGFLVLPMTIDGSGNGSLTFRVTGDPAAIGQQVFTQVIAADIFLPDPIPLVVSNGLEMVIGGSICN